MKVAQINYQYNSGSVGRIAHDLHVQMLNEGIESRVFCAFDHSHSKECMSYMTRIGLRFNQIENRLLGNQGFGYFTKTSQLVKDLESYRPDVIHLHNLHAFYMNCEKLFHFLKQYGKPVVWTFHDCWPFTGHCAYFDAIDCQKWKTGCNHCPCHLKAYPNTIVDRTNTFYLRKKRVFNSIEDLTIVTPSQWLADLVSQSFLLKFRVEVINNGIDLTKFILLDKESLKIKYGYQGKKVLLGVSSMGFSGRKGIDDFIELAGILPTDYQIILIGANQCDKKKIPSNIIAMGRTESIRQLNEYYSMADLFLNPTKEDNFPTTNIESLACGTPVITYRTGGSPESVTDNCGSVTQHPTALSLKESVLQFHPRRNQSEICRERAELLYSKELFSERYIQLYKEVTA